VNRGRDVRVVHATPRTRVAMAAGSAVAVALALAPWWGNPGTMNSLIQLLTLVALAQMWNLLAGFAGRVSVGEQAFIGLGAYTLVFFANNHGVNVFLCVPIAGVVAGVLALPIAGVTFRLQGGYFAIATWVTAEVARLIVINVGSLGGGTGTSLTALVGIDIVTRQRVTYWLALAIAVGSIVAVVAVIRSRLGFALRAAGDSASAASSLGVAVRRAQLAAFVISAVGCGMAGAVIYLNLLRVSPSDAFGVNWTAYMIFMVVIGGIGTIEGPIIGAVIFFAFQQELSGPTSLIALGIAAMAVTVRFPGGLWGWVVDRWHPRLLPITPRLAESNDA
jgi:branched-chain amino acid transport system permease protein